MNNWKLKGCEKGSGYWVLTKRRRRGHVRFSTVLKTDLAANYIPVEHNTEVSYTTFNEMPLEKRRQQARSYYELVAYMPWFDHPDKTFVDETVRSKLDVDEPEAGCR